MAQNIHKIFEPHAISFNLKLISAGTIMYVTYFDMLVKFFFRYLFTLQIRKDLLNGRLVK